MSRLPSKFSTTGVGDVANRWRLRTVLWAFLLPLLLMMCPPTTQARRPQLLLKRTKPLSVRIGREVFFRPEDLVFVHLEEGEQCRVQVVNNDPITQRVGKVQPEVFDCKFDINTVKYVHDGSQLLTEDRIKLRAHKFTNEKTTSETFYLTVNIVNTSYDVISFSELPPLQVTEFYGVSNPIDASVIQFHYTASSNVSCTVGFSRYHSQWPIAGQMVMGQHKSLVDAVKKDCREFLFMDLKYEHLKSPSPDVDYLPITVNLYDPAISDELISESYYIPIFIQGAFSNSPPRASFMSMYIMDVDQFVLSPIIPGVISAEDYETPVLQLVFNVSKPLPAGHGYLVNLDNHAEPITSFTQDDLENHKIGFQPPNISYTERKIYDIEFTVYDSHFASSMPIMLHVAVRPSATNAPRVSVNTGLTLLEGQSREIHSSNFQVVDKNNIDDVKVFIKGGLKNGRLEVNGRPTIYFTPADVYSERVVYVHDDSDTTQDYVEFRITDGRNIVRATLPITIIPKDDSPPYLIRNLGLELNEGALAQITDSVLTAHDADSLSSNIVYTVLRPPEHGELLLKHRASSQAQQISEFTQRQLTHGQIYYRHFGDEAFTDLFEFTLNDQQDPPNESDKQYFRIHVHPVNDNPPQIDLRSTRLMYVKETEVAYITKSQIRYTDIETKSGDLLYSIVTPPYFVYSSGKENAGRLISTHGVNLVTKEIKSPPVTTFKQADINHMKIAYIPPKKDIGPEPRLVRFVYTVQDASGNKVLGQHFDIEVQPVNNKKPKFVTRKLLVEEGGVLTLSTNQLSAIDEDTSTKKLKFVIRSLPHYGALQKQGVTMKKGDSFKLADLRKQAIRYLNDGSEVVLDSLVLHLSDGAHKVSKSLSIDIIPVDDQAPQLRDDLKTHLIVSEGGDVSITPEVLAAMDEDTEDELLTFLVVKQPRFGLIQLGNLPVTKFSQQEVKTGNVIFKHTSGEIGPKSVHDSATFIVSDQTYPDLSDLPVYDLNITITPVDNQKPAVVLGNPIFVNEGEKFGFTDEVLSAQDIDTDPSLLEFVIKKQPQWGYLENKRPSRGSEKSNAGSRISSFNLQDIYDRNINYVQSNHFGVEPLYDSLDLYVTDGNLNSPASTVAVTIVPQNDEQPDVMLQDFEIKEGGHMMMDRSMIDAIDLDLPKDPITFELSKAPKHGELMMMIHTKNGEVPAPLHEFNVNELHGGMRIMYKHDNTENFQDDFTFRISDGRHSVYKSSNITINPVNDEIPNILKNTGLKIDYGDTVLISSVGLQAIDGDTDDEHIYFIITKLPKKGLLQKRLGDGPPSKSSLWQSMYINQNFSQYDIEQNKVRYVHTAGMAGAEKDRFQFVLSDAVNKRHTETFDISVKNRQRKRNIALSNQSMHIKEGERKVITTDSLSASDESIKPDEIVFAVTKSPRFGQLEFIAKQFIPISSFTQLDLVGQQVVYHHLSKTDVTMDMFNFTVTNGFSEAKDGSFKIYIDSQDRVLPTLVYNNRLEIVQGSEEAITPSLLRVDDPDTPIHNLTFVINKAPSYGHLYNRGVFITQSFTQYDLDRGYISYEGYTSHTGLDHFLFTITDNKHEGFLINGTLQTQPVMFSVIVKPMMNDAPKLLRNQPPDTMEYLGRGRYGFILSSSSLGAEDRDTKPSQLIYVITDKPSNGHLENVLSKRYVRRRFSQKDLNDKSLWYVVDNNVLATNDSFGFRVEDSHGNILEKQRFELQWSYVEFTRTDYVVCENAGTLTFALMRVGSLKESAFVSMRVRDLSAKTGEDFIPSTAKQVQFDPGMTQATWSITIKDDGFEEPNERFKVMLDQPVNMMLGLRHKARVQIINANTGECPQYIGMISKTPPSTDELEDEQVSITIPHIHRKTLNSFTGLTNQQATELLNKNRVVMAGSLRSTQRDEGHMTRRIWKERRGRNKKDRKRKSKKRRRRLKTKSRRVKRPRAKAPSSVDTMPILLDQESKVEAPKPCDRTRKELLHFDNKLQQLFICDGKEWRQWRPHENQEQSSAEPPSAQPQQHQPVARTKNNCPLGWIEYNSRCYRFLGDRMTWNQAERLCHVNYGGSMVTVLSDEHHKWLGRLAGRSSFWIGLNDKAQSNKWTFLTGDPIAYTNWRHGAPRVRKKHRKNCVMINRKGKWKNKKCDRPKAKVICEKVLTQAPSGGFFFGF